MRDTMRYLVTFEYKSLEGGHFITFPREYEDIKAFKTKELAEEYASTIMTKADGVFHTAYIHQVINAMSWPSEARALSHKEAQVLC